MIVRAIAEAVLRDAIAACDPAARTQAALAAIPTSGERFGVALGKAALAMARGAGPVARGVAVVPAGGLGDAAPGWQVIEGSHPDVDEKSVAAGAAVCAVVDAAGAGDTVLALLSGGASALVEQPRIPHLALRDLVRELMARGAPIADLNAVRTALSWIKGGQLALRTPARVVTLAVSDVVGDRLDVIGSGPTVGPWRPGQRIDIATLRELRAVHAREVLARHALGGRSARLDAVLAAVELALEPPPVPPVPLPPRRDHAEVIAPLASCAIAAEAALAARGIAIARMPEPFDGDVADVAAALAVPCIAWGEATVRVPADHGAGGRAQQLALALARRLRGTDCAALVVGTDGVDGPGPAAGAFVDGTTWDAIADPEAALARCDAGTALASVGALVVTGPTGVNHADLVIAG